MTGGGHGRTRKLPAYLALPTLTPIHSALPYSQPRSSIQSRSAMFATIIFGTDTRFGPVDTGLRPSNQEESDKSVITFRGTCRDVSTRYGLHDRGTWVQFTVKAEKFVLFTALRMLDMGAMGSLPGVKAVGHAADHSLLSNAEVKNAWSYTCSGAPHTNRCPTAACGVELQCNQVFGLSWCPTGSDEQNGDPDRQTA